jgi:hypothetical protein
MPLLLLLHAPVLQVAPHLSIFQPPWPVEAQVGLIGLTDIAPFVL